MAPLKLVDTTREETLLEAPIRDEGPVVDLNANRVTVRKALHTDIWGIHDTLLDALDATETALPDPVLPYAVQALMDRIAQDFIAVAEAPDGKIVGCIVLNFAHWPWVPPHMAQGRHLFNEHFWVDPKYRKGGVATRLIKFAKGRASQLGLPLLLSITSRDDNTELKDRFARQQGMKQLGGVFIWGSKSDGWL
jgi:GNAT superfamily N-acetyltransferase